MPQMKAKKRIKAGDEVVVLSGNYRGERGTVLQIQPGRDRVLVEGINKRKFHEKAKSQEDSGGIREREAFLHLSNVMRADRYDARRNQTASASAE